MFSGFSRVFSTKTFWVAMIGSLMAGLQYVQGNLDGTMTVGAVFVGALSVTFRHAVQKLMDILSKK